MLSTPTNKIPLQLLSRCDEVTMEVFMQCMCDNNLHSLVVSGEATPEQIADAWFTLFYEYCDLIEAYETKFRTRLIMQLKVNKLKLDFCRSALKVIKVYPSHQLIACLKHIGYDFDFDANNQKQFTNDIVRCEAELASLSFDIKVKEAELELLQNKQSTKDSVDRKYFHTLFFRINNYCKREAVNGQSTVTQYCVALKDYIDHIERTNKEIKL